MAKIKITLKQLADSVEGIKKIQDLPLPILKSFQITLVVKKVDPELKTYTEKVQSLFVKHGEEQEGEKKGQYKIKAENIETYNAEVQELNNQEIEIEIPELKIADFSDCKIEAKYLNGLDWLIKE